jgi:tetratricopeptide (TPR) repeat protein
LRVLMGYEGIRLFVERAQAVQNSFELTASNAQAVARVCSQLDGIPLAIELTAARVRAMTVEQIAARLHNHSVLMTGGSRTALPRQQTLRATVDWSYALLSEPERLLLRRLAAFAGGWSLEACEEICSGDGLEAGQLVDLLTSLVDKSLVAFEERDPETGGRYRLLEIVRQYAAERLQASGETECIKARHRNWLVALAEAAEPWLTGSEQPAWLRRLETEHDNLRATLAWDGAEALGAASDLRLAGTLCRFWSVRGHISEGREHLGRVLAQKAAQERTTARAKALNGAGTLAYSQADYVSARGLIEESLSIHRELGDRSGVSGSLHSLGNLAYDQGDYASARAQYEEGLRIRRELRDTMGIAWSLSSLGNLAHPQGEYTAAREFYEESLCLFRQLGDRQGTARSLSCLGYVALDQGEYDAARSLFEESQTLFRELEDRGGIAWSHCCLGYAAFEHGAYDAARIHLEEGLGLFRELGDRRGVAWSLNSLGNVAYQECDYAAARAMHEESLLIRRELGDRQGMAWSLHSLGNAAHPLGASAAARAMLAESLSLFRELRDRKGVADSLGALTAVMLAQAEVSKAVRLWGAVHALRESIGAPLSPRVREKQDREIAQARLALGADGFAAAWEEGRGLTWEQAVSYALGAEG